VRTCHATLEKLGRGLVHHFHDAEVMKIHLARGRSGVRWDSSPLIDAVLPAQHFNRLGMFRIGRTAFDRVDDEKVVAAEGGRLCEKKTQGREQK